MATNNLKHSIISVPVVGYAMRIMSNIVNLPKLHDQLSKTQSQTNDLLDVLKKDQQALSIKMNTDVNEIFDKFTGLQTSQDIIRQQLSTLEASQPDSATKTANKGKTDSILFANQHLLDTFYTGLEDRFRGTEEMITKRLEEYLPYFQNSKLDFKKTPVLDIGCGRGELLQLLKKHDINVIGLDINYDMVERSKKKGLQAVQGDALAYLQSAKPQSYGAITGFHIVEHIPFSTLLKIFDSTHSALVENGFVIFETPNPENVIVGSTTFYMDPSHLHPLPPDLLAFALETCGFQKIEIKRLHPEENYEAGNLPPDVVNRLYGPRDFAVIGYK